MTNIHTIVTGDPRAPFGMPVAQDGAFGRVRVSSLRALPLTDDVAAWGLVGTTATAVIDTMGDFSGSHAWSPPD